MLVDLRQRALQRRFNHLVRNSGAIDWDPKMKVPRDDILVRAETYTTDFEFPIKSKKISSDPYDRASNTYVEYKHIRARTLRLPKGQGLSLPLDPRRAHHPYVFFTDDIVFDALQRNGQTWMSITPAEILSQRSGLRFSQGHVVVGGLGMGWFLHELSKLDKVTKITVVENDADLLDWFGNDMCRKYGADVICDDVWNVLPKMPEARFALDIWPAFFDALYDRRLLEARRDGYKIWAWGSPRGSQRRRYDE